MTLTTAEIRENRIEAKQRLDDIDQELIEAGWDEEEIVRLMMERDEIYEKLRCNLDESHCQVCPFRGEWC